MSIHDDTPPATPIDSWGLEPLMDVADLATYLGIPASTVYEWRVRGNALEPCASQALSRSGPNHAGKASTK